MPVRSATAVSEVMDQIHPDFNQWYGYPVRRQRYLHYALDLWFAEEVKPQLRGNGMLVRYADHGVLGFALP
jgi:hypothetical protein